MFAKLEWTVFGDGEMFALGIYPLKFHIKKAENKWILTEYVRDFLTGNQFVIMNKSFDYLYEAQKYAQICQESYIKEWIER